MVIIKFLGILVLIVVSVAVILFVTILSKFLNIFRTFRGQAATSRHNKKQHNPTVSGQPKPRNSKIDKNEGEYVDFEEID
ncbi:hypothetical protein HPS57_00830 [Prevotella sp. PINT]|jgi:hypothetical protein|uniref:DUF4834 family protein n=1 Tax=Palleniella intestinalis TaxID=2736291 RepID=UPI001552090C|nr:DUF4834 family protein [Palleniella intestinalis]NPD80528.1 hypothetical protein [Palleniella intestinalis]